MFSPQCVHRTDVSSRWFTVINRLWPCHLYVRRYRGLTNTNPANKPPTTCQEWTNVAGCRNFCPYWHVRNERAWHRAETAVHTDISGMNECGTVLKPLSILTCQVWMSVAPCRNHCPYWHVRNEWIAIWWHTDYISRTECRHPDYTTVRTDFSAGWPVTLSHWSPWVNCYSSWYFLAPRG